MNKLALPAADYLHVKINNVSSNNLTQQNVSSNYLGSGIDYFIRGNITGINNAG